MQIAFDGKEIVSGSVYEIRIYFFLMALYLRSNDANKAGSILAGAARIFPSFKNNDNARSLVMVLVVLLSIVGPHPNLSKKLHKASGSLSM